MFEGNGYFRPAAIAAAVLFACGAHAGTIGFDLTISGDTNVPTFTLKNTATSLGIDSIKLFIGDTSRNFDFARVVGTDLTGSALVGPDINNDGIRSDEVIYRFTSFDVDETFAFIADIDSDSWPFNTVKNYKSVLNKGGFFSAGFANGEQLTIFFPSVFGTKSSFSFARDAPTDGTSVIPLPAGLPLLLAGLGAFGIVKRGSRV